MCPAHLEICNIRTPWRQSPSFCCFSHHLLLAMSNQWFRGKERKSDMIGCPFCFPSFVAMGDTFLLLMQYQHCRSCLWFPPLYPVSSPSLCFNSSSLIPFSLSPLRSLSPHRLYLVDALILRGFFVLFCLLSDLSPLHLSAARADLYSGEPFSGGS